MLTPSLLLSLLHVHIILIHNSQAWIVPSSQSIAHHHHHRGSVTHLFQSRSGIINQDEVAARIADTDRGRSTSESQQDELEAYFQQLEGKCSLPAPARSPFVEGNWVVEYTTAPPPSNGQLGPFSGIAYQEVDLESGRYANVLRVPPNDWLSATLEASWIEWDGVIIEDDSKESDAVSGATSATKVADAPRTTTTATTTTTTTAMEEKNPFMNAFSKMFPSPSSLANSAKSDYGATCWVVTFETLTIKLFGVPLINQKFNNVKRVWRTTYVDENTRIVRAGRTGNQDDEMLFYMTRDPDSAYL